MGPLYKGKRHLRNDADALGLPSNPAGFAVFQSVWWSRTKCQGQRTSRHMRIVARIAPTGPSMPTPQGATFKATRGGSWRACWCCFCPPRAMRSANSTWTRVVASDDDLLRFARRAGGVTLIKRRVHPWILWSHLTAFGPLLLWSGCGSDAASDDGDSKASDGGDSKEDRDGEGGACACFDRALPGNVESECISGAPPTATGGKVEDGHYVLTRRGDYGCSGIGPGSQRIDGVIEVCGSSWAKFGSVVTPESDSESGETESSTSCENATVTASGAELSWVSETYGDGSPEKLSFISENGRLVLYWNQGSSTRFEVYEKQ